VRQGARPLDVVLTDFRLDAGETGIQAIQAVRAGLGRAVPALIVSAEGRDSIRVLADPLGVPVLEKPVAEDRLRTALRTILAEDL